MKNLLFLPFLILATLCHGQSEQFKQGQIDAQAGIGFVQGIQLDLYSGSDVGKSTFKFPPQLFTLDYGVTDLISVGVYANFGKGEYNYFQGSYERYNVSSVGVRGLYHFDIHEMFDVYGGVGIGRQTLKGTAAGHFFDEPPVSYKTNEMNYFALAGGRYRFTPTVGGFVELNLGSLSMVNLGLTIKLK